MHAVLIIPKICLQHTDTEMTIIMEEVQTHSSLEAGGMTYHKGLRIS